MFRPLSNRKAVPVSELTRQIRSLLEDGIGSVLVEGEVSNLRRQASGHQYFSLKDEFAQLRCVLFRGNSRNGAVRLEDGMKIQAFGDVSVYEQQGQYQLIVRMVQPLGQGSLQARFEALKQKLASEGLFEEERKQRIPSFCRTIVLVTSPTGAAVRDMLNVLERRAPWIRVLVYPVPVQGEEAAPAIVEALDRLDAGLEGLPTIDAILLGRGGGSLEDLWAFNEEAVARAMARCSLPIISAVGHEIDFTIADFVADLRSPTPSAAAEIVAPDGDELADQFESWRNRLRQAALSRVREGRRTVDLLSRSGAFREPDRLFQQHRQTLDRGNQALQDRVKQRLNSANQHLSGLERALQLSRPERYLTERRDRLIRLDEHLKARVHYHLKELKQKAESTGKLLHTLGPDSVFSRGFSMTTDESGNVLTSTDELKDGDRIRTRLQDGELESVVERPTSKD